MKPFLSALIAIAILFAAIEAARPFGLGKLGKIGNLGSIGGKAAAVAPPATPCSGTGLIFNVACNSQYIGIL